MGRLPSSGGPAFRFLPAEVAEMEARLQQLNNGIPTRAVLQTLADMFSASPERAGKVAIQPKQVWNWFQNRRYSHRAKTTRVAPPPAKMTPSGADHQQHAASSAAFRAAQPSTAAAHPGSSPSSGKNSMEGSQVEFEAKSARDGAWYDVAAFLSHRLFESGEPEVRVRFSGFGAEEDEWINVRKCVRQRSLPCEATECVAVLPGDLILCFQEGKEQALYFDARVLDAQRRRHDVRGCRCRFLVRYDHDFSEEIVPLRKVCRRPETDYRLQILHAARAAASTDVHTPPKEVKMEWTATEKSPAEQKTPKPHKMMDVNTDEVTTVSSSNQEAAGKTAAPLPSAPPENGSRSDVATKDAEAAPVVAVDDETQVVDKMKEGE
ncbi:protein SAWADEE HOMEODOMAIN HOMOLOG 2-like [Phragmites australis]|uniref:protein SAWADEE HOMEODOMAIN HOMOLOG 2-like n=1 Tax=Phragmites australis TaxID=29695 RepID=UPI002D77BC9D|nr:protein SAWADEE HOMEODOMAIN HOMOLOG 2-like [Phragmites australis]XP_062193271.1 protein SAWADEE HOMEODOMAIN HOMOLOG 2-like [Phragmites australis]